MSSDNDPTLSTSAPGTVPGRTLPTGRLHDLLEQVAAGDLDPGEAARLLDEDPDAPTVDRDLAGTGVGAVTVSATGVHLTVYADPSVATAVAEGPHLVRQEGDRLVFELPGRSRHEDGFEVNPRWMWGRFRLDWPYGQGERVVLRVNPALPLRLDLQASAAHVRGTRAPVEFGCFSGSLTLVDHVGPLQGTITTGSARIEAVLRGADDKLSCDMGSVRLTLLPGSDTTVSTRAEMGSLKLVGGSPVRRGSEGGLAQTGSAVVGPGHGRLEVAVRMGSAKVTLP
jgi:hypothetical protein